MDETQRRRTVQMAYNEKHGITPQTIIRKAVHIFPKKVVSSNF